MVKSKRPACARASRTGQATPPFSPTPSPTPSSTPTDSPRTRGRTRSISALTWKGSNRPPLRFILGGNMTQKAALIRVLLKQKSSLLMPGVYDALSAKLAARANFEVIFTTGYSLSATLLGEPDFGLLTQTEMLAAARRICAVVGQPVIVDADTGYGNAINVIRTVKELIRAGAAGLFLEDQVWPKRCGHMKGKQVIPLEEQMKKLEAALA